ncbi:hypothetical protein Droror1_Dr00000193 [Drosera rotundifolia]
MSTVKFGLQIEGYQQHISPSQNDGVLSCVHRDRLGGMGPSANAPSIFSALSCVQFPYITIGELHQKLDTTWTLLDFLHYSIRMQNRQSITTSKDLKKAITFHVL